MSELELVRRLMSDVPLLFSVISQDYMHPRRLDPNAPQVVGVMTEIYEQLGSIGYLNDMGHATPLAPSPSGKGYAMCFSS